MRLRGIVSCWIHAALNSLFLSSIPRHQTIIMFSKKSSFVSLLALFVLSICVLQTALAEDASSVRGRRTMSESEVWGFSSESSSVGKGSKTGAPTASAAPSTVGGKGKGSKTGAPTASAAPTSVSGKGGKGKSAAPTLAPSSGGRRTQIWGEDVRSEFSSEAPVGGKGKGSKTGAPTASAAPTTVGGKGKGGKGSKTGAPTASAAPTTVGGKGSKSKSKSTAPSLAPSVGGTEV